MPGAEPPDDSGALAAIARVVRRLRSGLIGAIVSPAVLGTLLTSVLGAVLCFLPGLDAPNYHAAFVTAVVGSLVAGPVGIAAAHRALRVRGDPFVASLKAATPAALAPIALLVLNGVRVRQCDVLTGVGFMFVGPVFSMLWAALLGAALAAWRPKKRHAIPVFFLVFLGWAALDVLHIYRNPAIFAFNPFVGFFSGAIYDTVIVIDDRLLLYRLANVAQILTALTLVRAAWDTRAGRTTRAALARAPGNRYAWLALAAGSAFAFWVARGRIGYEVSRFDVQAQLGHRVEDDRITLWYDGAIPKAEALALLDGHRFRLHQLERALGARYPRRIESYVYATPDQKRLLMGAAQVYIAKPWLDAIHLNRVPPEHSVIMHELAHVLLGLYADPPLRVPTTACVIPQMALVEGAAEAFEWDTGQLSPHEWSAAMRAARRAPDLRGLLGADGFYAQASDKAYTLTGSFVRWVLDTYGRDKLPAIYRDGDFEGVLGQSIDRLVAGWEVFVDALAVPEDAAGLVTGRFNVPAIHKRPCGLDVARVEAEAQRLTRARDLAGAREAYEQVVAWIPEDALKRRPFIDLAVASGDLEAIRTAVWTYLAVPGNRNPVTDASALGALADAIARAALATPATVDLAEAHRLYRAVSALPQYEDQRRTTLVKVYLSSDPRLLPALRFLLDGQTASLEAASGALPDELLVTYLVGRRHQAERRYAEALPLLVATVDGLASTSDEGLFAWVPWIRREAARLVADSYWALGDYLAARDAFRRVAELTPYSGDRLRYLDWAERCDWKLGQDF